MNRRNWKLDFLKILMSMLVVCLHMSSMRCYAGYMNWMPNLINAFGRVAVPVFFMITGTHLFRREKPAATVYWALWKRIALPLVLWSVFYVLYRRVFWMEPISALIPNQFRTGVFYHLSFLNQMMFLYLLAPLVQSAWPRMKRIEIMVLVIAIFVADNLANQGYYLFFTRDLYPIGYALLGAVFADILDGKKQGLHSRGIPVLLFAVYLLCSVGTCFMTVQASSQAGFLVETYL